MANLFVVAQLSTECRPHYFRVLPCVSYLDSDQENSSSLNSCKVHFEVSDECLRLQ